MTNIRVAHKNSMVRYFLCAPKFSWRNFHILWKVNILINLMFLMFLISKFRIKLFSFTLFIYFFLRLNIKIKKHVLEIFSRNIHCFSVKFKCRRDSNRAEISTFFDFKPEILIIFDWIYTTGLMTYHRFH